MTQRDSVCQMLRAYLRAEAADDRLECIPLTTLPPLPCSPAQRRNDTPVASPAACVREAPSARNDVEDDDAAAKTLVKKDTKEGHLPSASAIDTAATLEELWAAIDGCQRCPHLAATRQSIVFGAGNAAADIVFVGEAPGRDEDIQGIPFVGRAGQLLTDIIEKGMKMRRSDVYIANILKCRPPNNRNPSPDEVGRCSPFLVAQLGVIRPRVIIALGTYAAQYLAGDKTPISKMRGHFFTYCDIPVMPTFHPAYLCRNYSPENRKLVWEDIQSVLRFLEE